MLPVCLAVCLLPLLDLTTHQNTTHNHRQYKDTGSETEKAHASSLLLYASVQIRHQELIERGGSLFLALCRQANASLICLNSQTPVFSDTAAVGKRLGECELYMSTLQQNTTALQASMHGLAQMKFRSLAYSQTRPTQQHQASKGKFRQPAVSLARSLTSRTFLCCAHTPSTGNKPVSVSDFVHIQWFYTEHT